MTWAGVELPIEHRPAETGGDPVPGAPVPMPTPPEIDGFQRALLLDQRALCEAIATARPDLADQLAPLVAELYAVLRTPIYPKKGFLSLAGALVEAVRGGKRVQLYGVLASPTAMKEVRDIVRCATIFKRHGFTPQLQLLLARWETLVEIQQESPASRARIFLQQVRGVGEIAQQAGFADAVIPIDVEVESTTGEVLYPLDVRDWSRRVLGASAAPRGAGPSLARDVEWITGFHARQDSLRRLGAPQALFDLALRRAIGQRISAAHAARLPGEGACTAMVTLELHKRFLRCYEASLPIINLDGRALEGGASASAVA